MYTFLRNTQFLAPKWRAYVTPYEAGFEFDGGIRITSLWELKTALLTLDESIIASSLVKPESNLAKWVKETIKDQDLAERLINQTSRWGAVVALERQMMRTLNLPQYVADRWRQKTKFPFEFVTGTKVFDLTELSKVLPTLSEDTLRFHYSRFPNDLSVWLSDVVGDYYLADALEEVNSLEQAVAVTTDHMAMLAEATS